LKKTFLPYLLCTFILSSCGQNLHEKELNGKWYCVENDGTTKMEFYPDSLIFTEIYSQNVEWKANDSIFEFDFTYQHPYTKNETRKIINYYRLSKDKDSLFCEVPVAIGANNFTFIRAKNYMEYLSKKSGIEFNLPIDLQIEHIELEPEYGLKIFIKQNNSGLNGITEFGHPLDSLKTDLIEFKKNIKPVNELHVDKLKHESHFRVFADKSISSEKIATFLKEINDTGIDKVYRIYESKEHDNLGYLRGERIKTIANTGYNK